MFAQSFGKAFRRFVELLVVQFSAIAFSGESIRADSRLLFDQLVHATRRGVSHPRLIPDLEHLMALGIG